jgi:glutaredoxin
MRTKDQVQVLLYSKPGCHLCDLMKKQMAKADCADLYKLEEINIEGNAELLERYRHDIPVLVIDGVEAFRHRLTAGAFHAYIKESTR